MSAACLNLLFTSVRELQARYSAYQQNNIQSKQLLSRLEGFIIPLTTLKQSTIATTPEIERVLLHLVEIVSSCETWLKKLHTAKKAMRVIKAKKWHAQQQQLDKALSDARGDLQFALQCRETTLNAQERDQAKQQLQQLQQLNQQMNVGEIKIRSPSTSISSSIPFQSISPPHTPISIPASDPNTNTNTNPNMSTSFHYQTHMHMHMRTNSDVTSCTTIDHDHDEGQPINMTRDRSQSWGIENMHMHQHYTMISGSSPRPRHPQLFLSTSSPIVSPVQTPSHHIPPSSSSSSSSSSSFSFSAPFSPSPCHQFSSTPRFGSGSSSSASCVCPKYTYDAGILRHHPSYSRSPSITSTMHDPHHHQSLTVVSSIDDIMEAQECMLATTGEEMQLADSTTSAMEIMQDTTFLAPFQPQPPGGAAGAGGAASAVFDLDVLSGLCLQFACYDIPVGLINKLLALSQYQLNFIIDDSGSMNTISDALFHQATPYTKTARDPHGKRANNIQEMLTRWEEAEDRLHVFMDLLAYIPSDVPNSIMISFLNRSDISVLDHRGMSPNDFAQMAHQQICILFDTMPQGTTPLYTKLSQAFDNVRGPTMHYILTDGVPSDATIPVMQSLIKHRKQAANNPVTFLSCTNEDGEADWMKVIEEEAEYCAELDDFQDERDEVEKDHGPVFPYSRGFWLLCSLVAAINPDDLDALDESTPFTKCTMDNLMGRKLSIQEYYHYFDSNPNAKRYANKRQQFAREDILAKQLK